MVFVSLEGYLAASGIDKSNAPSTSTSVPVPHAERPPLAPVHVVVTPGSPAKPSPSNAGQKRSRLRRATSAFSSLTTTKHTSPTDVNAVAASALDSQFVVYVTDRDVHHKWVLAKTPAEYSTLKKTLQTALAGCACRAFACCGPLRRIVSSSQYKKPKRRWSDSRVVTQFGHCNVVQEYLNDLLLAVLGRDAECDATGLAWNAVSAFLDIETQRSEVADKILLRTVGGEQSSPLIEDQCLRRSLSEQLPQRRTSIIVEQAPVMELHKHDHDATDSDTDSSSDHDDEVECPICCASLDELCNGKTARLLCGHTYHTECVRVWLRMQHTCPVCRIPIEGM